MIAGKIKEMKVRSGLTNKQVSELSGVPLATVNRIMADQAQNPNFETISAIVTALGGSIDELIGHNPTLARPAEAVQDEDPQIPVSQIGFVQEDAQAEKRDSEMVRVYKLLLEERTKIIEYKSQTIAGKDQWIKRLFITCCVLVGIIIAVLLLDLFNPSVGFFQH